MYLHICTLPFQLFRIIYAFINDTMDIKKIVISHSNSNTNFSVPVNTSLLIEDIAAEQLKSEGM